MTLEQFLAAEKQMSEMTHCVNLLQIPEHVPEAIGLHVEKNLPKITLHGEPFHPPLHVAADWKFEWDAVMAHFKALVREEKLPHTSNYTILYFNEYDRLVFSEHLTQSGQYRFGKVYGHDEPFRFPTRKTEE